MASTPQVSVCVPTYNGAEYLEDCLESILAQTYSDIEILVLDDCSQDDTLSIAYRYQRQDPRIRVERNSQNQGLVGNWNRCVEQARGAWIKFVFQDDLIAPTCVEEMLAAAATVPTCLLIYCQREFLLGPNQPERDRHWFQRHARFVHRVFEGSPYVSPERYAQAALMHFGWNLIGEPTTVLFHRRAFLQFGPFNPHYVQNCDLEYWNRIAIHTGALYLPTPLASFRIHSGSTSARNYQQRLYRAQVLDLLIMRHDLACSPVYAPMRQVGHQLGSRAYQWSSLKRAAWSAWRQAQENEEQTQAWLQITQFYPLLAALADLTPPEILWEYGQRKLHNARHKLKLALSGGAPPPSEGPPPLPLEDDPLPTQRP